MIKRIVAVTVLIAIVLLLFWYLNNQQPTEIGSPVISSATLEEKQEDSSGLAYSIDVTYPQLEGLINADIQEKINTSVVATVNSATDEFRNWFKDAVESELRLPSEAEAFLLGSYNVEQLANPVMSVRLTMSDYTGGAHPNSYTLPINYNLRTGEEVLLGDVFQKGSNYEEVIFNYVWDELSQNKDTFIYSASISTSTPILVQKDTFRENFKLEFSNFFITGQGILFVFDPYQVGPYAAGFIEVYVPYEQVKDMFREDYQAKTNEA